MRGGSTLYLLALGLLSPGCALIGEGVRVTCREFVEKIDDCREHRRNRSWAEAAWAEVSCAAPMQGHADDYAEGFKDGFTAYLDHGGDGEPPLVAPARYRRYRYQTPQGYHAIEEWFAGYRHGVAVAKHSEYRRWITGPVGPPPAGPHGPAPVVIAPRPPVEPAPEEPLPTPRKVVVPLPVERQENPPPDEPPPAPRKAVLLLPVGRQEMPSPEEPPPAPRLGAAQVPALTPDGGQAPEIQPAAGQEQLPADEPAPAPKLGAALPPPPADEPAQSPAEPPHEAPVQPVTEQTMPAPSLGTPEAGPADEDEGNTVTLPEVRVQDPQRDRGDQ